MGKRKGLEVLRGYREHYIESNNERSRYMAKVCEEGLQAFEVGDLDRFQRTLGFVHGVLWTEGAFNLQVLEEILDEADAPQTA